MSAEESEDQTLRDAVAEVLDASCTIRDAQRYAAGDAGLDAYLRREASALGWTSVAAPESIRGSAMTFRALVSIYEELGAHLAPLPMLGQQLGLQALVLTGRAPSPPAAALVVGSGWASADIPTGAVNFTLQGKGDSRSLHGEAPWVLDDGSATYFLTFATDQQGGLHVLWLDAASMKRSPLATHDRTRSVLKVSATGLAIDPQSVLASGAVAEDLRVRLLNHAALALAADCVGGAATALGITLDYLKTRVQFGRAIGSFQALKHRAATMKIQLEKVRALLGAAVSANVADSVEATQLASLAKARSAEAYILIAAEMIQLHGGIGFTRESPCHLFLKRAKHNQLSFGDSEWHLDRAARRWVDVA